MQLDVMCPHAANRTIATVANGSRLGQRAGFATRAMTTTTAAAPSTGPREKVKSMAGTETAINRIAGSLRERGPFHARMATANTTPAPRYAPNAPALVKV